VSTLLEVSRLEVAYGPSQVLFGLGFAMAEGEAATLLGRNGMGKTTTLRAICGLETVRAGSIRFAGENIADEHLVAFHANRRGVRTPWTPARVYDLFPRLKERSRNLGSQLSGGEQQMLAIGRALVTNPRLLVLDEATEGLAPLIREEIWACLARLRGEGQSVLVVDKYVEKLIALADRHTIIERGQVVWQGSSAELDADHAIWHRYLGI
jgi:branched-chain amino acid transport system ATP-binding protein